MSALDEILSHNARHIDRSGAPTDGLARKKLCVVTCTDPRLTTLLEKALGLGRGDAVVVRLPGVSGGPDLVRAVATAVLLNGSDEILVLVPTDSAQTRSLDEVLAALARRGVQRTSLPADVRSFFNLQSSPRQAALDVASIIRSQPFLPADVRVHAATIDPWSGELTVVERAENIEQRATAAPSLASLGDLPDGLGVGLHENVLASSAGPVPFELPQIPAVDVRMTPFRIEVTSLQTSEIALKPTVQFGLQLAELSTPSFEDGPSLASMPVFTPEPMQHTELVPEAAAALPRKQPAPPRPSAPKARPASPSPRPPARSRPAPRQSAPDAPPRSRAAALPPELAEKIEKVRNFYLAEVPSPVRGNLRKTLSESYESGRTNAEMAKLAIKPILELGQKRYRIIDELIAVKDAAGQLDRAAYYSALMQLVQ